MAQASPIHQLARRQAEPLLATIGNTPLLRLERIPLEFPGIEIFGKAEYFNPGGSVKDRAARHMVLDGERSGKLNHDRTILDSTSGNTGIAYAMIGANRGYKVQLVLPMNASEERKRILKAYGARMVFSDAGEGSDGAIRMVRQIYSADPDRYFYPDQYNNPANWKAHFEGTGPEIIEQTGGRITHFVAAMGTSGTFMGTSRRLKRDLPGVQCISAQPSSGFHGLEGLKHMPRPSCPASTMKRWPTATCGSKPRTPTGWSAAWRAKRACWWESHRVAMCTPQRCWRAAWPPAARRPRS